MTEDDMLDVIIIGAGWAGLGAAKYINSHSDKSYLIMEARDVIGGRSQTITMSDGITLAETGSENIHGINGNPIFSIIKSIGIKYAYQKENTAIYSAKDGIKSSSSVTGRVPYRHIRDIEKKFWSGRGKFEAFLEKHQRKAPNDQNTSVKDILDIYVQKKNITDSDRHLLEYILHENVVTEYGADISELSSKWGDAGDWTDGDDVYLATKSGGGFSRAVKDYADQLMSNIQLNSAVRAIDYTDSVVTVHYEDLRDKGSSTPNIKTVKALNVIVTVPLGVLQARAIQFKPDLPMPKQNAIDELGNGALTKCFLLWDDDVNIFWPKDVEWLSKITSPTNDDERQGKWTEFYSPYKHNGGRPMLVGYAAASESRRVEALTNEEVEKEVLASLRSIFGGERVVPKPKEVLVTRWGLDEYSRGAYSYYKTGSTPRSRLELRKCLGNKIYFAGEATDLKNPQTVHGALESGMRAANEVLDVGVLTKIHQYVRKRVRK